MVFRATSEAPYPSHPHIEPADLQPNPTTMSALPIHLTPSIPKSFPSICRRSLPRAKPIRNELNLSFSEEKWRLPLTGRGRRRRESLVAVRAHQGFGYRGGEGVGGGSEGSSGTRVLSNLALAVGLAYLTLSGQLGWVFDTIASVWLLAVLLPVVGLGAFFWVAGRDLVQDSCPNCGNNFQIFKSSFEDGPQLCPFCTQPFSVQGNKYVREFARFSSNRATQFGQVFSGFTPRSEKGKVSSATVVDIEAEVRDID